MGKESHALGLWQLCIIRFCRFLPHLLLWTQETAVPFCTCGLVF